MYTNLVIAGGGLRTIPVIGSLEFIIEKDMLSHVSKFYGTSMGGLFCLLLILNYNINEMKDIIINFDINKLFDNKIDIVNLFSTFNLYNNDKYEKFIKLLLKYKINNENITLIELFNTTGKWLTCSTISLSKKKIVYINHTNYPDLPVYKLIMMTTSIPILFKPVEWLDDLYVDGGIVDNFPLYCIPSDEINQTLGINTIVKFDENSKKIDNIIEYINSILSIAVLTSVRMPLYKVINLYIDEKYSNNLINLKLNKKEIEKLIHDGYNQTVVYSQSNL